MNSYFQYAHAEAKYFRYPRQLDVTNRDDEMKLNPRDTKLSRLNLSHLMKTLPSSAALRR